VAGIRQGRRPLGRRGPDRRVAGAADRVRGRPVGRVCVRADPTGLQRPRRPQRGPSSAKARCEVVVLGHGVGDGGIVWRVYDFRAGMAVGKSESGYGELDVFVSGFVFSAFLPFGAGGGYWGFGGLMGLQVGVFGFLQYAVGVVSALGAV